MPIKKHKLLIGLVTVIVAVLMIIVYAVYTADIIGNIEPRMQIMASKNLRNLIEAEDRYFQMNGVYLPLDPDFDNFSEKNQFRWCTEDCSSCAYAVAVSGVAFTAEVRCPSGDNGFSYLGYVRSAPGSHVGIDGKLGKCSAGGIYAGSNRLVNTIGPCGENTWKSMAVASGNMKRLFIETIPSNTSVFVDGKLIGKTTPSHSTISTSYGQIFLSKPPNTPIEVIASRSGYSTARFMLDWSDYTYHATIALLPNNQKRKGSESIGK